MPEIKMVATQCAGGLRLTQRARQRSAEERTQRQEAERSALADERADGAAAAEEELQQEEPATEDALPLR